MKNIITFIFLSLCSQAFSLPSQNPANPALIEKGLIFESAPWMGLRIGYMTNIVTKARFHNTNSTTIHFKYHSYLSKITLNFFKRVDVYAFLGASKAKALQTNPDQVKQETPGKSMFTGGGGVQAILINYREKTFIGIDANYFQYDPTIDHIILDSVPVELPCPTKFRIHEWQLSISASRKIFLFTPYIGVNYFMALIRPDPTTVHLLKAKEEKNWGLFLGCSITQGRAISMNLEGKFFSQQEYAVSADFHY